MDDSSKETRPCDRPSRAASGHPPRIGSAAPHRLGIARLRSDLDEARAALAAGRLREFGDRPVGLWALPEDHPLPTPLMTRSLGDLVSAPFEDLAGVRGVGAAKMATLVTLLVRAARQPPPAETAAADDGGPADENAARDYLVTSEFEWALWRQTVRRHGLEDQPLGRFAPSLGAVTGNLWDRPLSDYLDLSLAALHRKRQFGPKRTAATLRVFHRLHEILTSLSGRTPPFRLLLPPCSRQVVDAAREAAKPGASEDTSHRLVDAVAHLVQQDAGAVAHEIFRARAGVDGEPESISRISNRLGITRNRSYQVLSDCRRIVFVRIPDAARLLVGLEESPANAFLGGLISVLYPPRLRKNSGGDAGSPAGKQPFVSAS